MQLVPLVSPHHKPSSRPGHDAPPLSCAVLGGPKEKPHCSKSQKTAANFVCHKRLVQLRQRNGYRGINSNSAMKVLKLNNTSSVNGQEQSESWKKIFYYI